MISIHPSLSEFKGNCKEAQGQKTHPEEGVVGHNLLVSHHEAFYLGKTGRKVQTQTGTIEGSMFLKDTKIHASLSQYSSQTLFVLRENCLSH